MTRQANTENLAVCVVVCVYTEDRWDDLVRAVRSLQSQSRTPDQIVVVVDHNKKLLDRCSEEFANQDVQVIPNTQTRGLSGARNSGIKHANADVIAFLDDDAWAEPLWCDALVGNFAEPQVVGVGGRVLPEWRAPRPQWWPMEFDWVVGCSYTGLPTKRAVIRNPIGASMAVRKTAVQSAGGFSPAIGRVGKHPVGCEETELFIRINQADPSSTTLVFYEPAAVAHHSVPSARANFKYFARRCFAEGLSKAVVSKMVGAADGLSSERAYSTVTLPKGVLRGMRDGVRGDKFGFGRAGAIKAGLLITAIGYARGRLDKGDHLNFLQSSNRADAS